MAKNRVFTREFKESVAQRMLKGESVRALHEELNIRRSVLYRWRDVYRKEGMAGFERPVGRPPGREARLGPTTDPQAAATQRIAELERKIGQQTLDLDFLRRAFKGIRESRRNNVEPGATASTPRSGT